MAPLVQIVSTTLEAEVQSVSRQLYAILVVKLEGKAPGIVQPGSIASIEVGVRGQVWEQTSCVVAENSQPKTWLGGGRKRWTLAGRIAEQVGEDHQPLPDSQW